MKKFLNEVKIIVVISAVALMVVGNQSPTNYGKYCNYQNRNYYFEKTGLYSMLNVVNESGYSYARLRLKYKSGTGNASGYWAPDTEATLHPQELQH